MSYTKGYKAFNKTGKEGQGECRGFLFKEGESYKIDGKLKLCSNGFHFCRDLVLTFEYYGYDIEKYCFAEVEAIGDIDYETPTKHKAATSEIRIIKFLSHGEFLSIIKGDSNSGNWNSGNSNSGHSNSGNSNSGNSNSGNWNSGNSNSGHDNSGNSNSGYDNSGNSNSGNSNSGNSNSGHSNSGNSNSGYDNSGNSNSGNSNSGNSNSGHSNSGNSNSGHSNSGNSNSGNSNSGHGNSGNWNSGYDNSGDFNTTTPQYKNVFNKPCLTSVWEVSCKPDFLYFELIEGKTYKESFIESFNKSNKKDVKLLLLLPNFNYTVFEEISGITKEMIDNKLKD